MGIAALQLGSADLQVRRLLLLPVPVLQTGWPLCHALLWKPSAHILSREETGISGPSSCVCGRGAYSRLLEHLHVLWLRSLTKPIVTALLASSLKRCSAGMQSFTGTHSS